MVIKVYQIDGDDVFLTAMSDYFGRLGDIQYQGASCSAALQQALSEDKPDVVLLDMSLEPEGGLVILEEIRERFSSNEVKVILISTEDPSEHELTDTVRLGADYFIQRPVDLVVLETRIRQLVKAPLTRPPEVLTRAQIQEICSSFFERMGIPPHYKGYRYLIEGIWLASVHPDWLNSVTQNLYPAIAQRFAVSGAQVERSMRYALDVTWEKGNVEQLYKLFPYVRESKGKPTNSAFIAKMVDLIRLEAR